MTDTGEQTTDAEAPPAEPDNSVLSWITYSTASDVLRPGAQRALVDGLLCPLRPTVDDPVPCSDRLPDPALFDRYSQVIAAMDGTEGSIRNTDMMDLNAAITQIVDAAIAGACCGNGVIDPGEDCDDGNQVNGDCCSSNCKFEPATTLCRPAAGPCDVADFCTGTSAACPSDAKKKSVCRAAAGPCDVAERCDGTHDTCPADAFKSADTECRAAAGVCDTAESCTGTDAACPADVKKTGDVCRPAAGPCDAAERCGGSHDARPADGFQAAGMVCRAAAGACDAVETCTGSAAACPADVKRTDVCRPATGSCDVAETCDGTHDTCPVDGFKAPGTECRASAGACDVAEVCSGSVAACPSDAKKTDVCRPAAGPCDAEERCDGTHDTCPADGLKPTGTVCRAAGGPCDVAESCDGSHDACPGDAFKAAGTECRAAAGACDVAESCTGSAAACPADAKKTDVCRPAAGPCDVAESCDGAHDACPADGLKPAGTECRAAGGVCDVAESCTGSDAACPMDVKKTDVCRPAAGPCDVGTGVCSNWPKADGMSCDDGSRCTWGDACQAGACAGNPVTCTAPDACHVAACNARTGGCTVSLAPDGTPCGNGSACWKGKCDAPPDCSHAWVNPTELWPPNHKYVTVSVRGMTDPDGDPLRIVVTGIRQDEPINGLGDGDTCPDASGIGKGNSAQVRAERSGNLDGRMYYVSFTGDDGKGGRCQGTAKVCVPHDQRPGHACGDQGPLFDSAASCR